MKLKKMALVRCIKADRIYAVQAIMTHDTHTLESFANIPSKGGGGSFLGGSKATDMTSPSV
jgi:hypothetical protein